LLPKGEALFTRKRTPFILNQDNIIPYGFK
jgi:hypothetical protein